MYWTEMPDPENPKVLKKVPNCDVNTFESTPQFQEICKRYPGYVEEFRLLIRENFGNTFCNIPSAILGFYCTYDAYNTLMIRRILKDSYSDLCVNIYLDNIRLGARLHSGGMYKDLDYHARYQEQCLDLMAYGITYAATAYSKLKEAYYAQITKDIDKYNDSAKLLLGRGEMFRDKEGNVDVSKIVKHIISNNLNELYDSGLDEPVIYEVYGEDIYTALVEGLKDTGTKADAGFSRKKKPFVPIIERLTKALKLDEVHPDENIDQYMFYKVAYDQFLDIWKNQMPDIYHIPKVFKFMGAEYDRRSYMELMKKKYFPSTSPKEYEKVLIFLMDMYKVPSAFLSMVYNNLNKIEVKRLLDERYNGMSIDEAYDDFYHNIATYPQELKEIAAMYLNDPYGERMTDTFDDSRG